MKRDTAGITLIEQLLVISIASLIIILGIHRYTRYQQQEEVNAIKADISNIFAVLDSYFRQNFFNETGQFFGKWQPDIEKDLNITTLLSLPNRDLKNFTARIIKTDRRLINEKPTYQFIISAKTQDHRPPQRLHFLAEQTNGFHTRDKSQLLQWQYFPQATVSISRNNWILMSRLSSKKSIK